MVDEIFSEFSALSKHNLNAEHHLSRRDKMQFTPPRRDGVFAGHDYFRNKLGLDIRG